MIILGTNSIKDTGYDVANSCRFNSGSSDYLHKTPSGAGTSADLFTFSMWIKRGIISSSDRIVLFYAQSDAQNFDRISFTDADVLEWKGVRSDSQAFNLTTSQVFRDISSWYHLHFIWDSADSTADNRMRIYVNGTQVTAFGTRANPSSGLDAIIGSAQKHSVGSTGSSGTYYDGYMAEVVYLDGQELTPDGNTGEFDEDSGIWKPIDVSGLTFGTNGFYLDFEDSSALGNDAAGSNNFTVNNLTAIDQSTDTCTNNFATMINASSASKAYTLSEGNLKVTGSANNWYGVPRGSIGVSSGKWYFEVKVTDQNNNLILGYMSASNLADVGDRQVNGFEKVNGLQSSGYIKRQDSSEANIGYTWSDGDIAQIALDMDNKKLWIGKNNSYYNSGNPATGSNETIGSSYFTAGEAYLPITTFYGTNDVSFNFGSPPYAISSGNTDGNGYGNFEYAVPSGYYSLNTKNLAEYG